MTPNALAERRATERHSKRGIWEVPRLEAFPGRVGAGEPASCVPLRRPMFGWRAGSAIAPRFEASRPLSLWALIAGLAGGRSAYRVNAPPGGQWAPA